MKANSSALISCSQQGISQTGQICSQERAEIVKFTEVWSSK